jgi:hypothetical protein
MMTPEEFLRKIHKIAASAKPEQFEAALREMCQRLAREILNLKEQ